jgi:hypothetical protein
MSPPAGTIIYCISQCFREVSIFKPVTSDINTSEYYLVCKSKRSDFQCEAWIQTLLDMESGDTDAVELPPSFILWLSGQNDLIISSRILYGTRMLNRLAHNRAPDVDEIDVSQCLVVWNLPSTLYDSDQICSVSAYASPGISRRSTLGRIM